MKMAYRLQMPGGTIEADTAREIQELLEMQDLRDLLKQKPQPRSELQQSSVTDLVSEAPSMLVSANTVQSELQQTQQTFLADLAPETSDRFIDETSLVNESDVINPIRVPSVQEFCRFWFAIKREPQREVIRLLAKRGHKKLPIQELEQHIEEKCKGPMGGLGRIFRSITGLTWTDYFILNNSQRAYEVNKIAHQNLVRALEIVEPQP